MLGVAIGSQFLLRNGGGSVNIPSFRRDFAGVKTLNHGIGPDITFTRTGTATYFDATGTLTTATANVPRFDHNPVTFESKGLLIEEGRTNSLRNSQAGGSTNGVIGSGGVLPTNWNASGHTTNGVSTEIIGTGTESGLTYVDIKVSGTPTATASAFFNTESPSQIVAANGQTWTATAYTKLAGGSVSNATFALEISGRDSGGGNVSAQGTSQSFIPTSSALAGQRISATRTFSSASVERVLQYFKITYTSGSPINFTLRIAAPQLEQGAFATSYIPTTSAAVTRGADNATVTPISSFISQSGEETLFSEFSAPVFGSPFPRIVQLDQDSVGTNNRHTHYLLQSTNRSGADYYNNGVNQYGNNIAYTLNSIRKTASGIASNNGMVAIDGTLLAGGSNITLATTKNTHLQIGNNARSSSYLNGHIRKIAYYPKRLSNETLKSLTA